MKFSKLLDGIQEMPEWRKKVLIWAVTIFLGIILFGFWGYGIYKKVNSFDADKAAQDLNIPQLEDKINSINNGK
jgi:hypothetical protein